MGDQIGGEQLMGPLWFSKHLLSLNSAVLSAFIDMASLDLHNNHIAVPRLPIRKLRLRKLRELQCNFVKIRELLSAGIHTQVGLPPSPLLLCLWSFLFYHQALIRAYSLSTMLSSWDKEWRGNWLPVSSDSCDSDPAKLFTLAGMALEWRNSNQMKTGLR